MGVSGRYSVDCTASNHLDLDEDCGAVATDERLRILGHLAAGLCHELAQPLLAAKSYLYAAQTIGKNVESNARLAESLWSTREQLERAIGITRQIRHFVQRGRPASEPFDPNMAVQRAVGQVLRPGHNSRIKLSLRLSPDLPNALGNSVFTEQVVINLVQNSMQACETTRARGGLVEVETVLHGSDQILCSVSDNGPGFDVLQPSVSAKPGGMCVGLALSRTIIEASGGEFWLESKAQGGAKVSFTLPVFNGAP